jgi:ABC-2 type transport system ATP-binding protein
MDDLAALCDEVTILSAGRLVFSGPVSKLAAETDELDYRIHASDTGEARRIASAIAGVRVLPRDDLHRHQDHMLVVRASVPSLDQLVAKLVGCGIAVRELAPVVSPLEAAFLALTDDSLPAAEEVLA